MPLVRAICDKVKCAHNDDTQCICPINPHFTTPAELQVETADGKQYTVPNSDEMQLCEQFVRKV